MYCFVSSAFFAYLASRSKNKGVIILCYAISILIPGIMGGLRHYTVGTDSSGYGIAISRHAMASNSFSEFGYTGVEPGCRLFFYYGVKIWGDYTGAFMLFELFTLTCIYIGAYRHKHLAPLSFIILVFLLLYYNRTYNEIRQCTAAAIIFMGMTDLERKRYLRFAIHIIFATCFHYSAAVTLPLFIGIHAITTSKLYQRNNTFKLAFLYGTIVFLLLARPTIRAALSTLPFLAKYTVYFEEKFNNINVLTIEYFGELIMLLCYGIRGRKIIDNALGENNYSFYEFSIIFYLAFNFGVQFMDRVLFYSEFANILFVSALPGFVKEKSLKVLVAIAILITALVYWYRMFVYIPTYYTYPYRSIL